ncbi:MAG: hypothetical protein KC912_22375 [Proteobacteria bacterium]|nr:hypothetical protein [Pseudomonadota bacterium]
MLFLLSMAFAAPSLDVTTRVPVAFPGAGLDLGVEVVRCTAEVQVAADGSVSDVQTPRTEACPEPFAASVDKSVALWRFAAPGEATTTEVPFKWRLKSTAWPTMTPEELAKVIAAHEPVPLDVEGCELRMRIGIDGSIDKLRSSSIPECLVMPLGPARNPKRLRREADGNVICTTRFTSDRGVASDIDLSECPEKWQLPADIALRSWQWQTGESLYQDYTVRFVFLVD